VARGQARGREGLTRAAITVAIMVGPSLAAGATLLIDPARTGTAVPVLLALALIDRGGRRWWVPVAVAVVLGWAMAGGQLVMMIGVAPLLLVGAVAVGGLIEDFLGLCSADFFGERFGSSAGMTWWPRCSPRRSSSTWPPSR
jgi:hypothetical protein